MNRLHRCSATAKLELTCGPISLEGVESSVDMNHHRTGVRLDGSRHRFPHRVVPQALHLLETLLWLLVGVHMSMAPNRSVVAIPVTSGIGQQGVCDGGALIGIESRKPAAEGSLAPDGAGYIGSYHRRSCPSSELDEGSVARLIIIPRLRIGQKLILTDLARQVIIEQLLTIPAEHLERNDH